MATFAFSLRACIPIYQAIPKKIIIDEPIIVIYDLLDISKQIL